MREVINLDYSLLIPEYILGLTALIIITVDLFWPKVDRVILPVLAGLGLIVAFFVSLAYLDTTDNFAGLFYIDDYTTFFRCFFMAIAFAVVVASVDFVNLHLKNPAEYYALILISTAGAVFMAGAGELLTAYIGLEILSFSLYVLVSYQKNDTRSN